MIVSQGSDAFVQTHQAIPFVWHGGEHRRGTGGTAWWQVFPDDTQEVLQRIYNSDGSFSEQPVGIFVYHPSHGHIHFEGYAVYRLFD